MLEHPELYPAHSRHTTNFVEYKVWVNGNFYMFFRWFFFFWDRSPPSYINIMDIWNWNPKPVLVLTKRDFSLSMQSSDFLCCFEFDAGFYSNYDHFMVIVILCMCWVLIIYIWNIPKSWHLVSLNTYNNTIRYIPFYSLFKKEKARAQWGLVTYQSHTASKS